MGTQYDKMYINKNESVGQNLEDRAEDKKEGKETPGTACCWTRQCTLDLVSVTAKQRRRQRKEKNGVVLQPYGIV